MTLFDPGPARCPTCGRPITDPAADREGMANRTGPATEHEAARRFRPGSGSKRARVLAAALHSRPRGVTDDELEQLTGYPHQTASARRNELVNGGYLTDSGLTRPTRRGYRAIVWEATPLALAWQQSELNTLLREPPA